MSRAKKKRARRPAGNGKAGPRIAREKVRRDLNAEETLAMQLVQVRGELAEARKRVVQLEATNATLRTQLHDLRTKVLVERYGLPATCQFEEGPEGAYIEYEPEEPSA